MNIGEEKLPERHVTYTLEYKGKFYIVENVPVRVNEETGEQFFFPGNGGAFAKNHHRRFNPPKSSRNPGIRLEQIP